MTTTVEYVESIRASLRLQYPAIPPCDDVGEEPAGDFGIAHTFGVEPNGCCHQTYDVGTLPTYHTIAHEHGHCINAALAPEVGAWSDAECVQQFWALRNFPVTIAEAERESALLAADGSPFAAWQRIPVEVFAEEFAAMVTQDGRCLTYNWGTPRDDLMLHAFFALLGTTGGGDMVSKEEFEAYKVALQAQLDAGEARILKVVTETSNRISDLERFVRDYVLAHP